MPHNMFAPVRKGIFWAKEFAMGRNTWQALRQIQSEVDLGPAERRERQWSRLQSVVRRAALDVPLYRELWRGVDLDAALECPEAFGSLVPILRREDLANAGERIIAETRGGRIVRGFTSGSTFSKISYLADRRGSSGSEAARVHARRRWGLPEGAPEYRLVRRPWRAMMSLEDRARDRARWLGMRTLGVWSASAIMTGPEDIARRCEGVWRYRPAVLFGSGGALLTLADYVVRTERQADFRSVQSVIYMAEPVDQAGRALLEKAFDAPVISDYSCNEIGLISYTCPAGNQHLNDDFVWYETVGDDGRPTVGQPGHLVVTVLTPSRTPLVRYRLGDVATLADPDASCACGSPQHMLKLFEGREMDRIRRPDGTYIGVLAAVNLALPLRVASHWHIRVSAGRRLCLVLEMPAAELAPNHDRVLAQFQRYAGPAFECSLETVDRIDPQPNGKYARVVREQGWDE